MHREKDKLRNIPCSWTGRLNIINTTIFLKLIYRFDTIFFKIPASFFKKQKKADPIFIWKSKDLEEPNNLEKQKQQQPKIKGLTPNFKTVWSNSNQENVFRCKINEKKWDFRTKSLHLCYTDFSQSCQDSSMGERITTYGLGTTGYHMQQNELRPLSHTRHKNLFKWIKDLNVWVKMLNHLKENIRGNLCGFVFGKEFFRQQKQEPWKIKLINWTSPLKLQTFAL